MCSSNCLVYGQGTLFFLKLHQVRFLLLFSSYGIMDASCMVRLARDWKPVEDQKRCKQTAERIDLIIPGRTVQRTEINVAGCDEVSHSSFPNNIL